MGRVIRELISTNRESFLMLTYLRKSAQGKRLNLQSPHSIEQGPRKVQTTGLL
jgi:hypothetical protein